MTSEHAPTRVVIFAKAPTPELVKTRLIPALGAAGAAQLAAVMLEHTVEQALSAQAQHSGLIIELCVAPNPDDHCWQWAAKHPRITLSRQTTGDLGQRLHRAATNATGNGEHVILIGTDCPDLTAHYLLEAATALTRYDAVMCPTQDGGYALLGLRSAPCALFTDIPWSTEAVASMTLDRLQEQNMFSITLSRLQDIDRPADLRALPPAWQEQLPAVQQALTLNEQAQVPASRPEA